MKYLVTGGTGFLGRYIVRHLQASGNDVFITARHPILPNHIKADFENNILELSRDSSQDFSFDYVIHAAGIAHFVPKSAAEKNSFFEINVNGTKLLLNQLEKLTRLPKSFVFISSVSVYGLETGLN